MDLGSRIVRYADLRPCTTAFIDARTPGSDRKENFTIIGPGVAENPDQHVHISEPHGFNIGGARQPPRCVNSQHFHETAEVFLVHSGTWAFRTGEHADEGEIILRPGDVISIPVHIFRGFENVGDDVGFLFAVLGGDDPGRVIWAPDVLKRAEDHGLLLLENGRLIDTLRGERAPSDVERICPMSADELKRIVVHCDSHGLADIVVRSGEELAFNGPLSNTGVTERAVIGAAAVKESAPAGKLSWPHGFVCRRIDLAAGARTPTYVFAQHEVIFVHSGAVTIDVAGQSADLSAGDTISLPPDARRTIASPTGAQLFVTRRGDPSPAPRIL
jgi:quercetin dioxygenase-like cupin family protein